MTDLHLEQLSQRWNIEWFGNELQNSPPLNQNSVNFEETTKNGIALNLYDLI